MYQDLEDKVRLTPWKQGLLPADSPCVSAWTLNQRTDLGTQTKSKNIVGIQYSDTRTKVSTFLPYSCSEEARKFEHDRPPSPKQRKRKARINRPTSMFQLSQVYGTVGPQQLPMLWFHVSTGRYAVGPPFLNVANI